MIQRYTNDLLEGKILSEVYLGLGAFFRLKWLRLKWHMNCQTKMCRDCNSCQALL